MTSFKCKNCGADIRPDMKFCGTCGTPLSERQEAENGEPAAAGQRKKTKLPVIVIVVLIAAAGIVLSFIKPSKYEQLSLLYLAQEEDRVLINPDKNGKAKVSIEGLYIYEYSFDSKTAAVVVNIGSSEEDEEYSLYYVADKATFISDEVGNVAIAGWGESIVFTGMKEDDSEITELYIWEGGKTVTITEDYVDRMGYSISPDGKTVAYTVYDEAEDEYVGCYYNGDEISLGKDVIPIAISDGAKYVYYAKNGALYVQLGTDSGSRRKLGDDIDALNFNKSRTDVIFSNGTESYICRNGGEKELISGTFTDLLLPEGTVVRNEWCYAFLYQTHCIADFAETFYKDDDDSIYYIDSKYKTNKVVSNIDKALLMQDGKTIIYQKGDSIYKVNGMKENGEEKVLVEEDVIDYLATSDGKAVYFYNMDNELMYQKGNDKPVLVGEDLEGDFDKGFSYVDWAIFDGNKIYYVSDNELFWSTGGKGTVTAVDGMEGDIISVRVQGGILYVGISDETNSYFYQSNDGENFHLYREREKY